MTEIRPVEGPAYGLAFKLAASVLVAALALGSAMLAGRGAWSEMSQEVGSLALLLWAMVAYGYGNILFSRTAIDGTHIRQHWLFSRQVLIADITQLKLVYVPSLAWILAPRLVVRTGGLLKHSFHSAAPEVIETFQALAYGRA